MNFSKARIFLWGVFVISFGVVLGTMLWLKLTPRGLNPQSSERPLEGLNDFGAVPDFSLVERSGKSVGLAQLRGKIWVADFIYTTCIDTCPLQTAEMARLQDEWKSQNEIELVSFSVDPERDTAEVLSRYAERYKAHPQRWLFLTGTKKDITRLIQDGFRLSAAPAGDNGPDKGIVLHSARFVLVDQKAQIRGYYDSQDPAALRRLKKDVGTLLNRKGVA